VSGAILTSSPDITEATFRSSSSKKNTYKINLVNNHVTATLRHATASTQLKVDLYNLAGKTIYSSSTINPTCGFIVIPEQVLKSGMYLLSISEDGKSRYSSAIVLLR
jgi:hypothetical protein